MFFLQSSWAPDIPSIVIFVTDMSISSHQHSSSPQFVKLRLDLQEVTRLPSSPPRRECSCPRQSHIVTCIAVLCGSRKSTDESIVTGKSSVLSEPTLDLLPRLMSRFSPAGWTICQTIHQTWSSWRRHSLWRNSFFPSLLASPRWLVSGTIIGLRW